MLMLTVPKLIERKNTGEKITLLTAYDYPTAKLLDEAGIDIILVGDSLGMEELGYSTTIPVTMDIMVHHSKAVSRAVRNSLVLVDMPFLSYQVSEDEALRNAGRLIQEGGANMVKIEGGAATAAIVKRIVEAGIPVMGHVGYRPQSVNMTGVSKQGKDDESAEQIVNDAIAFQEAGAFSVLMELIPDELAARITKLLAVPTIGIGAGPHCDGQVLVTSDIIKLQPDKRTYKHVKEYANIGEEILRAVKAYKEEVQTGKFPS